MLSTIMHRRIAELANQLFSMRDNAPKNPTNRDRDALMAIREKIKNLADKPGIQLSASDETDRSYLYVEATALANKQEDFYEKNGRQWEKIPYAEMTDEEAQTAVRSCIRRHLRGGTNIEDIHAALREDVGVTGVSLDISPEPVDGILPILGRGERFQFKFMANGPRGDVTLT